jgi:hypothetical protein
MNLDAAFDQIELRAAVELAKRQQVHRDWAT